MTASLLPNGKQQFLDQNGKPLASGQVEFFIPNTTTQKDTWQDAAQTILNSNPVLLDAAGEAVIYGYGTYRQVVKDVFGNTIWDKETADYNSAIDLAVAGVNSTTRFLADIAALRAATSGTLTSTSVVVEGYYGASDGGGGVYVVNPGDGTSVDNSGTIIVDASGRRWYLQTWGKPVSVKQFGAKGDGVTDDAPAFRLAVAGASDLVVPKATYLFASTVASPWSLFDPPCVLVDSRSGFQIVAEPGTTIVVANAIALSHHFMFNGCSDFKVSGFTHEGNRSGLNASQENSPFALNGCLRWEISDCYASGDWTGASAFMAADWCVDGVVRNCSGDAMGQAFDVAFFQNVLFEKCRFFGAATYSGGAGTGAGIKGFSIIYDVPNAGNNNSGVNFTNTNEIEVVNCDFENFQFGIYLLTGTNIKIRGGKAANNPGNGAAVGVGVYMAYGPAGNSSSAGFPLVGVLIDGVDVEGNGVGSTGSGFGIYIDAGNIANTDIMQDFVIVGNRIYNNTNTGFGVGSPSKLANILLDSNLFDGALQTTAVSSVFLTGMNSLGKGQNGVMRGNLGTDPGFLSPALPGGIGVGFAKLNSYPFPVEVTFLAVSNAYTPELFDGTTTVNIGSNGGSNSPFSVLLRPGVEIYIGAGTVPGGWIWQMVQ